MGNERESAFTRREVLSTLAVGGAALAMTACAGKTHLSSPTSPIANTSGEQLMNIPTALAGNHTVVPLPFAANSLNGISEKMISSHHENNYGGAVRNLNRAEQELAGITKETPPFVVTALRDRELTFRNSKTLHEAYFANLGGNGKRSGSIEKALHAAYGTTARWEEHMHATAMGLGGGSGWAILTFELDTGALRTFSSGNHKEVLGLSVPLLVLDMYEHSYQMDFGAAAARYIDAFFANSNWDEVNRRLEHAQKARTALHGVAG